MRKMLTLYSQFNAARLGLIYDVGFSLILKNLVKTIPLYNDCYMTGFSILGNKPLTESNKILLNARFNFRIADQVIYKIDPVSIKNRKKKQTTQTLNY